MKNTVMNQTIQDLTVYLELNQLLNKAIMKMYTVQILNKNAFASFFVSVDEFSTKIFQLLPVIKIDNEIILDLKSGILLIDEAMEFCDFRTEFQTIIKEYSTTLIALKKFRNKMQHEPHNIDINSLGGSNEEFEIEFVYKCDTFEIKSTKIRDIVKRINDLFSKLVKKIKSCNLTKVQSDFINGDHMKLKFDYRTYIEMNQLISRENKRYLGYILEKL